MDFIINTGNIISWVIGAAFWFLVIVTWGLYLGDRIMRFWEKY